MIRNALESINGVAIFPIISLLLFVAVFGGMTWWALRLRRTYVNHMGHLPLEEENEFARKEDKQ